MIFSLYFLYNYCTGKKYRYLSKILIINLFFLFCLDQDRKQIISNPGKCSRIFTFTLPLVILLGPFLDHGRISISSPKYSFSISVFSLAKTYFFSFSFQVFSIALALKILISLFSLHLNSPTVLACLVAKMWKSQGSLFYIENVIPSSLLCPPLLKWIYKCKNT